MRKHAEAYLWRPAASQAAFGILSQELYGPLCPFERANDLTLSICCHATGIVKVRGHGLFWGRPLPELADALQVQVWALLYFRLHRLLVELLASGAYGVRSPLSTPATSSVCSVCAQP